MQHVLDVFFSFFFTQCEPLSFPFGFDRDTVEELLPGRLSLSREKHSLFTVTHSIIGACVWYLCVSFNKINMLPHKRPLDTKT